MSRARDIPARWYHFSLVLIFVASFMLLVTPLLNDPNKLVFTGYTAVGDIQRLTIISTGHIYSGQLNNQLNVNLLEMESTTGATVGGNSNLGFAILFSTLELVPGLSSQTATTAFFLPLLVPFLLPLLVLGLYKRMTPDFKYSTALLLFGYASFASIPYFLQPGEVGITSARAAIYLLVFVFLGFNLTSRTRMDIIPLLIFAAALVVTYHTLTDYAIIMLASMSTIEGMARLLKRRVLVIRRLFLTSAVIIAISAFSIFNLSIQEFGSALKSFNLASVFSGFVSYPGIASPVVSSWYSWLNIIIEIVAGSIVLVSIYLGFKQLRIGLTVKDSTFFLLYIGLAFVVLGTSMLIELGVFTTLGRIYQAALPFVPILLVYVFLKFPNRALKLLSILVLVATVLGAGLAIMYPAAYPQLRYGLPASTVVGVSYLNAVAPTNLAIFGEFSVTQTFLDHGHLAVYQLSQYMIYSQFRYYSNSFYDNVTKSGVAAALANLTGTRDAIFIFQTQDLGTFPLENNCCFSPSDPSYLVKYMSQSNLVFTSGDFLALETGT